MRELLVRSLTVSCALAVVVLMGTTATAATHTWIGGDGSSQDWSESTNWDGVGVPVSASTSDIIFSSGIANRGTGGVPLNQNIGTPLTVNSLTFSNTPNVGGAYHLGGSQLRFEADGATQPSIVSTNWQSRYFANDIELAASATLDLRNAGYTFYFDGAISGDGALLMTGQAGGGQVYLNNAANSYTGGTTYKGTGNPGQGYVVLRVPVTGALGTGLVTLDGGNLNPYNATTNSRPGGLIFTGTGTSYANNFSLASDSPVFVAMTGMGGSAASSADLSGDFDLNGNALYLRGIGTGTIAGDISSSGGGGSLVKIDSGTWVLSGTNTYAGATTVDDGILKLGSAGALGSSSGVTVASGATVDVNGFNAKNIFTIAGTGTSGQGALVNSGGDVQGSVGVTLAADATIGITGGRMDIGIGRPLVGGGFTLTKVGAGRLPIRSAAGSFGAINVDEGLLYFETDQNGMGGTPITVASGAIVAMYYTRSINAPITLNGGTLRHRGGGATTTSTWSGPVTVNSNSALSASGGNLALTGSISGAGGLDITGPYMVTLSGTNSYNGATNVNSGILTLGSAGALGNSSGVTVASGATVDVNGFNANNNFTIAGTGTSGQGALVNSGGSIIGNVGVTLAADATIGVTGGRMDIGYGRPLVGNGFTLTKVGAGQLPVRSAPGGFGAINVDGGIVYFENNQTGMGGTPITVASGATVASYYSIVVNAPVTLDAGTLRQLGGGGTGTWSGPVSVDSTSTLSASGGNLALTGPISGAGGLNIIGPNTVTLSGTNSYNGATNVNSGILQIGSADALGNTSGVTVASGATFDFNGFKPNKNFTISGTGTSGQGALYSAGYLIGNVGVTLAADATIGVGGSTGNRLDIGSGRPLDGGGFTLTKIGIGRLPVRSAANNFAGIKVDEGQLYFEANQAGMASTLIEVASGATLAIYTSSTNRSVNAPVVLNGGSLTQLGNHSGTSGTWTGDVTVNSDSNVTASSNNMAIDGTIGGNGGLNISGPYTVTLTGDNAYTGATAVNSGTLVVDGSIASSAGLSLAAAATLEGHGTVPTISGAGLVSPGNSPGILTAASVDPTGGLDFALEFTALGSPDYTDAMASLNDVLRLTDAADPFTAALDGTNSVGIYFDASQIEEDDVFRGGFYTDLGADFADLISDASFAYYITGDGGGTHDLGGQSYYTLGEYNASMGFDITTVAEVANFGAGNINGYVMQLTASVPEPAACLLLILGLSGLLFVRRR